MTGIEQLLADVGIPADECPTCKTCNWFFKGAVDVGLTEVRCRTCGRVYGVMTWLQALESLSARLAFAAEADHSERLGPLYHELIQTWNDLPFRNDFARRAILINPGTFEDNDDGPPF